MPAAGTFERAPRVRSPDDVNGSAGRHGLAGSHALAVARGRVPKLLPEQPGEVTLVREARGGGDVGEQIVRRRHAGYQWVLLLSGHAARHTAQIMEVKESPAYPKQ